MISKQMIGFNHFSQVYAGVRDQNANQSRLKRKEELNWQFKDGTKEKAL